MKCKFCFAAVLTNALLLVINSIGTAYAFSLFDKRSDWEQAVSAFTVVIEDFDATESQLLQDGDIVSLSSGITLAAQAPDSFAVGSITSGFDAFESGQILLGSFDPGDALILSFAKPAIAIGFDYLDINRGGVQMSGLLNSGAAIDRVDVPRGEDAGALVPGFFGIVLDAPVSQVTFSLAMADSSEVWDLDRFSFAITHDDGVDVSEPSLAIALLSLTLGSLFNLIQPIKKRWF